MTSHKTSTNIARACPRYNYGACQGACVFLFMGMSDNIDFLHAVSFVTGISQIFGLNCSEISGRQLNP